MMQDLLTLVRGLALIAGMVCLGAFWLASDNVWQEIAWGVYATALFALATALRPDEHDDN